MGTTPKDVVSFTVSTSYTKAPTFAGGRRAVDAFGLASFSWVSCEPSLSLSSMAFGGSLTVGMAAALPQVWHVRQ